MAMKKAIGFEWGTALEDPSMTFSNLTSISTTQKRQGAYSFRIDGGSTQLNYWMVLTFDAALSEFYLQYAFYINANITSAFQCFAWRKGSTVLGGLANNIANAEFDVYSDNFVTKIGSLPYSIGSWQVFEFRVKIGNAPNGIIQVRRDMGNLAVDFAGDTQPGADTAVDNVRWGNLNGTNYSYIDDIILNDITGTRNNSWPGGLRIIRLAPTGDQATLQFTPTPGPTHYTAVDEVPPSATDNLVSGTAGHVDEMTMADCPVDVQTIAAVMPVAFGTKGSSNPPTRLAIGLQMPLLGPHYTADQNMAVSQAVAKELWEESPDRPGNVFSVSEINASNLLLKSVA